LTTGPNLVTGLVMAQALAFALALSALPALPAAPAQPLAARSLLTEPGAGSLLGYSALVGLFGQLPVLMLKAMSDVEAMAAFGSALRYYGLLLGVVSAANVVLLPRVVHEGGSGSALPGLTKMLAWGAGLLVTSTLVGYIAIPYIDGGKYAEAPRLFVVISLGLLPGLALAPVTALMLKAGSHGHLLLAQIAAVLVCVATTQAFRSHGAFAAAAGIPAGVLVQFGWLFVVQQRSRRGLSA
jgi:O-antigen/teichoic acid export membrane protein